MDVKSIIIDCDTGVDDALAIDLVCIANLLQLGVVVEPIARD